MPQSWMKTQVPTLIILAVIAIGVVIYFSFTADSELARVPALTPGRGTLLAFIGYLAGVLGCIIGTGGCSVMLPVIHFWMG